MVTKASGNYIPTLDGMRAIAILMVIVSHTVSAQDHPNVVGLGHLGVMIFFSLSGFLITTRLMQEFFAKGRISLSKFYIRRVFRILPPALFYLGSVWLLARIGVIVCSTRAVLAALFLYINYANVGDDGWRVGHFWSLSVEEHFYLFWPALLIAFGVRKGWRTAGVLAVLVICWRLVDDRLHLLARLFHDPALIDNGSRTDLIADALLWGCCLAFLVGGQHIRLKPAGSTMLALGATAFLVGSMYLQLPHSELFRYLAPSVLLGAIVVCPAAPIGRLLELPPLRFVGKLSYSLYIWQQMFLGGPGKHLWLPLALVAIVACALASYGLIEQPCIRIGHRWTRKAVPEIYQQEELPLAGSV